MSGPSSQKGFTLIELILVITILGVISASIAQVISLSAQIYVTGAERTRLVSEARFIILRLEKELRNIVPNSVSYDPTLGCLTYYPIKQSGTYVDDAFDNPMHVVVFNSTLAVNDTLVVYPTNPQSVTDNGRTIDAINSSADAPTSVNQHDITLNTPVNQTSPGKRFFVPEAQVSVCKATTTAGEALVRTQSGTSGLIATNVSQWSANISTAGLQQNGLIELQLTLQARGDEPLSILHEIHFPNVP
ncbi:prepilin-type N-terminal cleavage/methylation domain-containing protein [Alteromonas genovensis]|uniref:Prepilin-type N-terminal cleavage/methylation domain-containing protein n=1 Tax=Alteromonas genovensis TaxID=471225 RepID=A0A6N9TFN2_9ALTE|nr:type II secretion system protein [Alteromonas genovensis]NDW15941.1 prepilin-type N-terminal cleavage/methylation domain-containing protein [Alteromonas genovensis]